jgi:hypothetical protein
MRASCLCWVSSRACNRVARSEGKCVGLGAGVGITAFLAVTWGMLLSRADGEGEGRAVMIERAH